MNQFEPSDFGNFKNWSFLNTVPENAIRKVWPTIVLRQRYRIKYGRPAPIGINTINLLENRRYPKRVLGMKMAMAAFGKPKSVVNFTGRVQQKGTCWFQTIVNGWLLSKIGRKVIKERLTAFKKSSNVRALTKNQFNACPSRKHIPQAYFWSYIEHMLNTKEWNTKFRLNVLRGIQFPEGKLIRSSGLRSPNKNVVGGSERDVFSFNDILFNGKQEYFVFSQKIENPKAPIPEKIKWAGSLSHVYIVYGNHAIAGYIGLNGNPMIYDSNRAKPMFVDWVKSPRSVLTYLKLMYPQPASAVLKFVVTYVRHYIPSNAPPPETRKINKTKFNIAKIYRYNKNNYIRLFKNNYTRENFENNNRYNKISNPVSFNNVKMLVNYVAHKNTIENRPALRRKYREKFGKHAPGNMSNENIKKVL